MNIICFVFSLRCFVGLMFGLELFRPPQTSRVFVSGSFAHHCLQHYPNFKAKMPSVEGRSIALPSSSACPHASDEKLCSWRVSSVGCKIDNMTPNNICGEEGCIHVFHHACQWEWKYLQYNIDYPNGDPSLSSYDSEDKKHCIHHHPHHEIALSSTASADGVVVNEKSGKKVAPRKKPPKLSKEDKWRKRIRCWIENMEWHLKMLSWILPEMMWTRLGQRCGVICQLKWKKNFSRRTKSSYPNIPKCSRFRKECCQSHEGCVIQGANQSTIEKQVSCHKASMHHWRWYTLLHHQYNHLKQRMFHQNQECSW